MVQRFVLVLLGVCLGASNLACVSAATYEHDLETARAEVRAAQQSASVQLDAMRTALMALQRSLTTEAELRATTVRMLEEKLVRMESQRGAPASSAPAANLASNDLEFLRAELKKMHEQEQESSTRMRRIEEALQRLSNPGTKPIAAPDGDVKNPWGKLHAYPYLVLVRAWVPWLLRAARAAELASRGVAVLRDELLSARLSLEEQQALTLALYQKSSTYTPGGSAFESGLFSWEEQVFARPSWPSRGRILVGAAGAGREALALHARGYEVVAFEPCEPLAAQGALLGKSHGFSLLRGSYADLIEAMEQGRGPLASIPGQGPFDAVVLGWSSLSHILDAAQRSALLRGLPRVAPGAPVLMSFLVTWPRGEGEQRLRGRLRRLLRAGNAPYFSPDAGFFHLFAQEEIDALAAEASYRVDLYREDPYPHALLLAEVSSGRP